MSNSVVYLLYKTYILILQYNHYSTNLEKIFPDFALPADPELANNKNEYDKLYHPGSAPALIYGTPKMHKF